MIENQSSQQIMVVPYFERNLTLLWGWREMSLEIREPSKEQIFCYLRSYLFFWKKQISYWTPYIFRNCRCIHHIYIYICIVYIWYSLIFQFCYIFCMCVFQFQGFQGNFSPEKTLDLGTEVQTWSPLRLRRTSATAAPASNPWRRLST